MMAIKTATLSLLYAQCVGKSNAVRAELPVSRQSGKNSETVRRKLGESASKRNGGAYGEEA